MAYDDLREWIKALEDAGELKRIREEVSPELEITEITDRVSKIGAGTKVASGVTSSHPFRTERGKDGAPQLNTPVPLPYAPGGPALLFENVKGHPGHKVLINQFGSQRRMALALGVGRLDEIAERIKGLMNVKPPTGLFDKLKMLPQLGALTSAFPKTSDRQGGPLQGSRSPRQLRLEPLSHPQVLAPRRRPLHHPALRTYPRPAHRASATSACTACRSTTARPPACTGSGRR